MQTEHLLTIKQAAARLGIKPETVRRYISGKGRDRKIKAVKIGTRITPEELARFKRERKPRGRPKTKKGTDE